jgi:hypothetical protein
LTLQSFESAAQGLAAMQRGNNHRDTGIGQSEMLTGWEKFTLPPAGTALSWMACRSRDAIS